MSQIADFLRARYQEQRQLAIAAKNDGEGKWDFHPLPPPAIGDDPDVYRAAVNRALHIQAQQPDAVIADLDAKLALADELDYEPPATEDESDADLHARRAHPAWEYATTEGPRKQWDDADVPPANEAGEPDSTWERNVDAGRDGWERWDYTEESYWRRLRPDGPRPPYIPRGLRILAQPFAGHPDHKGEEWAP